MAKSTAQVSAAAQSPENGRSPLSGGVPREYLRVRDFEFVQPLYDLAFLLEIDALTKGLEVPKYRTFSLWRAAYSLDGYGTTIDRWLEGAIPDKELDYVPTARIKQYLLNVRETGTLPELIAFEGEEFSRSRRLRSIRGLGPAAIAQTLSPEILEDDWLREIAPSIEMARARVIELYRGINRGPWQSAHVVPPLLRFLATLQSLTRKTLKWGISGISDPFEPVTERIDVYVNVDEVNVSELIEQARKKDRHFLKKTSDAADGRTIVHQMGWAFVLHPGRRKEANRTIQDLVGSLDPLSVNLKGDLLSDLHLHTAWSDGSASVNTMAAAIAASGLEYFAVTDHSRSEKLQGGLTPILWLRQANALSLARPVCPVLHGIEVDILKDGTLDLPHSLLAAADIVVASVHSNWSTDPRVNTDRLLRAIESGNIDVLAHPTSAVIGKMGVPDYVRPPAHIHWSEVFDKCAQWNVAVEFNCFPSRLDLSIPMLRQAVEAGCALSIGSDAHARSHLLNLRFGQAALRDVNAPVVLNRLSYDALKEHIRKSRGMRTGLTRVSRQSFQGQLPFDGDLVNERRIVECQIQQPREIPAGSRVVGIDLTAGDKLSGIAHLDGFEVETCSLMSDDEILSYIRELGPKIVSIDSPLGLPGGGVEIDQSAGIVRAAERDLASIGISAYPALIDSMKNLTLRGIRLRKAIEAFPHPPKVIESYPGAAQDILCIPRKQKSLALLREGLRRLGLKGRGLDTRSHDEMDAITSAIVGRYFEADQFEPMGIPAEAQLIVPKVPPLQFDENPIICLAGKTGAGKSVVARYLSVFFGFQWVRTREVIKNLLLQDAHKDPHERLSRHNFDPGHISEKDLHEFGVLVLNEYKQVPLQMALTNTLQHIHGAVVVDSIRDLVDIGPELHSRRSVQIWFVDCNDSVIQQRLISRAKVEQKTILASSPIDQKADSIRMRADKIISNNGSLEDLRWNIDDTLFSSISIHS